MDFPADVPVLTDDVVTLRAHRLTDVPGTVEQCNDPDSIRWTTVPVPYGEAQAVDWISATIPAGWSAGTALAFAVEHEGRYAGTVGIRPDSDGNAEIAYGLAAWARGAGIASRAVRLLLDWGFTEHGFTVVHWRANVGNWGSRRVAWAAGFHFGPTIPGLLEQRGERRDAWTGWIGATDERRPGSPWFDVPVLETDRLRLRLWRDDEVPRISEARTNEATAHFLPFIAQPFEEKDARWLLSFTREQAAAGLRFNWCVADRATDVALGNVTLFGLSDPGAGPRGLTAGMVGEAELGYWAHPEARGQGVMSGALREVARWYFAPHADGGFGGRRLKIQTAATNKAARRVAESVGFRHVGTERAAFPLGDGTLDDKVVYDLVP